MAFSRRAAVVGMVGAGILFAVACSDSDTVSGVSSAGEAGESTGGGGSPSAAGTSSGSAGHAGTSQAGVAGKGEAGDKSVGGQSPGAGGEGGMVSTAGKSGGGTGGVAGTAGTGGVAGTAGMAGASGSAGAGGDGGAAGAGGAGGAASGKAPQCYYECEVTDDCKPQAGNSTRVCNQSTHHCQDPSLACKADADCLPALSGWTTDCVDNTPCLDGFEVCVKYQDKGFCASLADPAFPDFPCLSGSPLTVPQYDGSGDADVCGITDPRCVDESCVIGCADESSLGCGNGAGDSCSATTGRCECQDGSECDSEVCGTDSRCAACATAEDCPASPYQGATVVCQ